ncbi:MAG: glycosyltransferase family 39 protein [Candidatus Omnitrophica bacterium]|nr:glycosyltransferase family 39 protein [Candidatus Omnitrophota bacterium]
MNFNSIQGKEKLVLILLLCIYLFLAIWDIKLPGLYFDEAYLATGAIDMINDRKPVFLHSFCFLNRYFPGGLLAYHYCLGSYLLLPFFFLFGINVISLRICVILFGVLALVLTYLFAKEFFNKKVAFVTALLLATSPSFIIGNRVGFHTHSYIMVFSMGALFCLFRWYKGKNDFYFLLGVFLLGLGMATTLCFMWFAVALSILFFFFIKDIRMRMKRGKFGYPSIYYLLGVIIFCLGAFLMIITNFTNNFESLRVIGKNFPITEGGINNFHYINNLSIRIKDLIALYNLVDSEIGWYGSSLSIILKHIYGLLFLASCLWLSFSILFKKKMNLKKKRVFFILILFSIAFLQTPFTPSQFRPLHLFFLFNLILFILVAGFVEFIESLPKIRVLGGCKYIPVLILTVLNLTVFTDYLKYLKITGGELHWSGAIYNVAEWIENNGTKNVIAAEWGFSPNLYVLTKGEKEIGDLEIWCNVEDTTFKIYKRFIENKNNRYLFWVPRQSTGLPRYALFIDALNNSGKQLVEEKIFYKRDGMPVCCLCYVK